MSFLVTDVTVLVLKINMELMSLNIIYCAESKFSLAISQKHHLPGKTWYQRYLCPLSKIRSHEIEGSEMLLLLPTRGKFQWGKFQITFDTFWYQAVSNTKFKVLISRPGIQMINSIKLRDGLTRKNCCFVEEDFGWKFTSGEKNDFFRCGFWIFKSELMCICMILKIQDPRFRF